MQSFTITTVLAFLATAVVARNCTPGLEYCGKTLQGSSNAISTNYQAQIDQALFAAGKTGQDWQNSIFHCVGGNNGVISYVTFCPQGCHQNPTGVSDVCNP
ncbi:hypothetical protein BGZ60DRAFT_543000 [Tricladium varicosporioides]|nr:hypothetical protein BGZ60DRAFT_543000 [Hymenoscyphus varicosporioides]